MASVSSRHVTSRKRKPSRAKSRRPKKSRSISRLLPLDWRLPAPRGGYWLVSVCAGNNKWDTLDWIGSHFEADYLADTYRRRCRRVAVHREGQPPRERTASVLPIHYRPPERDAETIQQLLAEFVRSNDKASAIVLNDALIEDGYDWAAYDLRDSLARGCRNRQGLAERILSEVLNDSTVLEHGVWGFGRWRHQPSTDQNPYVLIREQTPVRFRGGGRATSRKREPRLVLWSRSGVGSHCKWSLFGSYPRSEFGSMEEAESIARADIAYEKRQPPELVVPYGLPDAYDLPDDLE